MDDEQLLVRVEDPVVRDLGGVKGTRLVDEVALLVAWRQDLADPVWPDAHREPGRELRHALAAPADQVVAEHGARVVDVGLGGEPPAAGPAAPGLAIEAATQRGDGGPLAATVLGRRRDLRYQLAADQLEPIAIRPGERVRLITGSAAKKSQGAPPAEEEGVRNYHLFLQEPVLARSGELLLLLKQFELCRTTIGGSGASAGKA